MITDKKCDGMIYVKRESFNRLTELLEDMLHCNTLLNKALGSGLEQCAILKEEMRGKELQE
jgi:hypothetical protein